jgi:hypothetical protein
MKIPKLFFLIVILSLISYSDINAAVRHAKNKKPPIGAPIDGGLLTILAASGIAYYGVRKNRKDPK